MRGRVKRHFLFLIKIARADEYLALMKSSGNPFVILSEKERLGALIDGLSAICEKSPGYFQEKMMKNTEFDGAMDESVVG